MANIIGGKGYRWRGRSIRIISKNNIVCVAMPKRDSFVLAPVNICQGKKYFITIAACKNGGNGNISVGFFGGVNYEGKYSSIAISKNEMANYNMIVTAPKFPNSVPMNIRILRPSNSSGNIFIKAVSYELLKDEDVQSISKTSQSVSENLEKNKSAFIDKIDYEEKKIIQDKSRANKQKVLKPKNKINKKNALRENKEMYFKPYNVNIKPSVSQLENVLVCDESKVPRVSIITPTRNGLELIKSCYEAIVNNTSYPNWEWIVGDSNSDDGTCEYLASLNNPKIKIVKRNSTSGSFSSINNELTKYASGDYYLFLNNDTEPQPFWLYEMMSKIHRDDSIGIVGSRLLYSKDKIQHCGIAFTHDGPVNIGKSVLKSFPHNYHLIDRYYQAVTAACMLIRKSDFISVGGFGNEYYFCYEDVDLCLKVREKLHKKVLYAANSIVIHKESITQNKYKTAGDLQKVGIKIFKDRWMNKVEIDFIEYMKNINKNKKTVDISFVTCVNNYQQYRNYVLNSLFKSKTKRSYEAIPIINFGNKYSAASALNEGIDRARSDLVVLCHQDVIFYDKWIDILYNRIDEIDKTYSKNKWGVLGTAGISTNDDTIGVVHSLKGKVQWESNKKTKVHPVQTVDEHCMIIRKSSGLRFDSASFDGFHFYGPDLCLLALKKGFKNFGILNPLVHDSTSASLSCGKSDFMKFLNILFCKWKNTFSVIRTPTSIASNKGGIKTFVKF